MNFFEGDSAFGFIYKAAKAKSLASYYSYFYSYFSISIFVLSPIIYYYNPLSTTYIYASILTVESLSVTIFFINSLFLLSFASVCLLCMFNLVSIIYS